jgi:hypothetical protein
MTLGRSRYVGGEVALAQGLESGALRLDRGYRVRRYETYGGRVLSRCGGIRNRHHLRPELARLVGHRSDLGVTLDRSDVLM